MATDTREEIRMGQLAIRYLVEGKDSGGPSPFSSSTSRPEPKCPSPTATTPARRPSTASNASSSSLSKDTKSKSAPATHSAFLDIPLEAVHRFDNLHSATSRTLAIATPGILTPNYFREIATIFKTQYESLAGERFERVFRIRDQDTIEVKFENLSRR